jgi:hypothetical protein
MSNSVKVLAVFLVLAAALAMVGITPASARGAAANIMNSPGYQRALEESRKRYRESYSQPHVRSPQVDHRKKRRHHNKRH